ncbi:MAG: hypothetical protein IIC73_09055 [Armatimonadetes bacterium]|nr:hypothetical protein [Armatimonadota bacterium]
MITTLLFATTLATAGPTLIEPKIVGASLFKNGYAVIVRELPLPASGEVLIKQPAGAALGTLWVTASEGVTIDSVVSTKIETEGKTNLTSLDALLTANVGKVLTIEVHRADHEQPRVLYGTIVSAAGSLLVLKLDDGSSIALQKNNVQRITSLNGDLTYQSGTKSSQSALRIRAKGTGNLYTICLERGLTWAPGYHVDITDGKKLKITSKATIMNDGQKLDGVDVRLITGFPHVRYLNILDPLTSGQSIDAFLSSMMRTGMAMADAGALAQNAAYYVRSMERSQNGTSVDIGQFDPLEGLQLEDLFFYTREDVTLDRGERGYYMLFQEEAEYEHVYTLDIPETGWWQGGNDPSRVPTPMKFDVWHTLEFTNPSAFPLTTAAATTFKDGEIIGQDMLSYVPPKGLAHLKITKAMDIQNDLDEQEIDREIAAIKRTSYTRAYDLVSAKGTVEVVNYKSQAVTLKVTKWLVGEVSDVSHEGETVKNKAGLRSVNPNSEISWTIELEAGEKVELQYAFHVYVPTP